MNGQDISASNPESKPSEQVTSGSKQDKSKTKKIFRIETTVPIFHERNFYIAAESAAEALRKHEDGFSADEPFDLEELVEQCLIPEKDDEITDEPVQVTDPHELDYARRLITGRG